MPLGPARPGIPGRPASPFIPGEPGSPGRPLGPCCDRDGSDARDLRQRGQGVLVALVILHLLEIHDHLFHPVGLASMLVVEVLVDLDEIQRSGIEFSLMLMSSIESYLVLLWHPDCPVGRECLIEEREKHSL